ncbi:MAG: hypothetical protein ACOCXP_04085 [Candidatus Dojkabacteria bacterium]
MSATDFAIIVLSSSVSVAILALTFQVFRLLGNLNSALFDIRYFTHRITDIVDRVAHDYKGIRGTVSDMFSPLTRLSALFATLGAAAEGVNKFLEKKLK